MQAKLFVAAAALAALALFSGCLGSFASNQARRQAARSADYYIRTYAEPEIAGLYANDPNAQVEIQSITREGRNYVADVVVRSGNERQRKKILVDDKGRLIEER